MKLRPLSIPAVRRLPAACLLLYSLFVFCHFAFVIPAKPYGDAFEYDCMAESLLRHGSPELRDSDIAAAQEKLRTQSGIREFTNPRIGYFKGNDGKYYSYHFWLYSLLAAPAKAAIGAIGGDELRAFGVTNALLYIAMLWVVFLRGPEGKKLLLTALMLFSPMVPYITWPHPEVFCAALAAMALAFYLRGNLARAAFFSALASCQNPPIAFFTLCAACAALHGAWRQWKTAKSIPFGRLALVALGCLPVFFAPIFYWVRFSTFNLIAKVGAADFSLITYHKLHSYFFDINQGAVLYSGLLLFVFLFGLAKNIVRRRWRHFELAACVFVMAVLSLPAPNWNCGLSVAIRYFAWCYPFLAFYVACAVEFRRPRLWHALLAGNMALLFFVNNAFAGKMNNLHHTNLAEKVLTYCPFLYNPEHDIFAERVTHAEGRPSYPVAFVSRDGRVTKILTTKGGWERLAQDGNYLVRDPAFYSNQFAKFTREGVPRYIDIPHGQIAWAPTLELHGRLDFASLDKDLPGLSLRSPSGRWTTQKRLSLGLLLDAPPPPSAPLVLRFDVEPHLAPSQPRQTVDISAGDRPLASWTFTLGQPAPDTTLRIPRDRLEADGTRLLLRFRISDPHSPKDLGIGPDTQKLGIAFNSIERLPSP